MAINIAADAGFLAIDTSTPKTVNIPLSTDRVGRVITIKDRTGGSFGNPITLQLQGGDTFENGATSYSVSEPYGVVTIISRSGQWLFQVNTQELNVSSFTFRGAQGDLLYTQSISTGSIQASTLSLLDATNNSPNFLTVSSGTLLVNGAGITSQGGASILQLISTVEGLGSAGYLSTVTLTDLVSTPYLDTTLISTVEGLGTVDYVSVPTLSFEINKAVDNLGDLGYISSSQLTSTVEGLGSAGYLSSVFSDLVSTPFLETTLISTVEGLGTSGYVSSLDGVLKVSTLELLASSIVADTVTASGIIQGGNVLATQGSLAVDGNVNTSYFATLGFTQDTQPNWYFQSDSNQQLALYTRSLDPSFTVQQIMTFWSTAQIGINCNAPQYTLDINGNLFASSIQANYFIGDGSLLSNVVVPANINSTIEGLGTAGYVSTLTLYSTSAGIVDYISTFIDPQELTSTIIGLGSADFVSTIGLEQKLQSTVGGLGDAGYVSTSYLDVVLASSIVGLGSASYVSSLSLVSTFDGIMAEINITLNAIQIVSTPYLETVLLSTVNNLGSVGYISSLDGVSNISTQQLLVSSIGVGCNAPYFPVDVAGILGANVLSSPTLLASSFSGTLADAQTIVVYDY